jgi:pilus assembly protein CpaE
VNVFLLGSAETPLEPFLRAPGSRVTSFPLSALDRLAALSPVSPDVVVLDLRAERLVPAEVAAFRRQYPDAALVMVAPALDPVLMLEAMRAGINECVTEPLTQAAFDAAFDRLLQQRGPAPSGETFAFVGAKGGVGTTTLAMNAAVALARAAGKGTVLFIDLHAAHGDAAVLLGAEPRFSVLDALENIDRSDEAFFRSLSVKTAAGVELLASSERRATAPLESRAVKALLALAARLYRYVVLDVSRSDAVVLDSLDAAGRLVLIANQELGTVRNAGRIASALRQRYGGAKIVVVANRFDQTASIGLEDMEQATGVRITHRLPSDYRRVMEAVNQGEPLVLGQSPLAARVKALALDLAGLDSDTPARGLFSMLKGRK